MAMCLPCFSSKSGWGCETGRESAALVAARLMFGSIAKSASSLQLQAFSFATKPASTPTSSIDLS
jgi:hypothetical protein